MAEEVHRNNLDVSGNEKNIKNPYRSLLKLVFLFAVDRCLFWFRISVGREWPICIRKKKWNIREFGDIYTDYFLQFF